MNIEVVRALAPHEATIRDARLLLDATNADPKARPLEALPAAGALIRAQADLIHVMRALLDTDLQEPALTLRIHGRMRALGELQEMSDHE